MITPRIGLAVAAVSLAFALAPAARAQIDTPLLEPVVQASAPIYVADRGDGRLFIVERAGYIRILASGVLQSEDPNAFLDIQGVVNTAGEGGLTSMAFDPDFATNKFVYVMYTRTSPNFPTVVLQSVIARYTVMGGDPDRLDPASAKELLNLDAPSGDAFTNHKGGQLQFGPDNMLYIGFGDGGSGNDPNCAAQTRNLLFGKILRIDPHGMDHGVGGVGYGIPADNPFASDPNYAPEIWLMGLRNPWRFSFDRSNGDLWIADVGQTTREEVDLLTHGTTPGENYGWNVVEGLIARPGGNGDPIGTCPAYVKSMSDPTANYTPPIFDYDHNGSGASITGGYRYRGAVAEWQGRYLYADFVKKEVRALRQNGADWQSVLLYDDPNAGWSSFGEGADGELYLTDLLGGWVYKLHLDRVSSTKANTACVTKLNEGFGKLANTASKLTSACVAKAAKGKLGGSDIETCSSSDPKLAKLGGKNTAAEAKHCGEATFGYTSAANGNAASTQSESDLAHDVFGADLDLAIVLKADDKNTAACQKAVLKGVASCQKARRAEFVRCKKVGLKKGTIVNLDQLTGCLGSDPKGKVAKVCSATTGKLATKTIEKSCTARGVDLSTAFPGCETDAPDVLAQCLANAGCERSCEMFDSADGLDTDCAALCGE
jgi:glucose/arabinose dehydrogenase